MTATHTRNMPQVGDHVEVYWPHDQCYYAGYVSHVNIARDTFRVNYEDGDVENLKLQFEEWRFVPRKQQHQLPTSPVDIRERPTTAHTTHEVEHCEESLKLVAKAVFTFLSPSKQDLNVPLYLRQALDILLASASDRRLVKALKKGPAIEEEWLTSNGRGRTAFKLLESNLEASASRKLTSIASKIQHSARSLKREQYQSDLLHAAAIVLRAIQELKK